MSKRESFYLPNRELRIQPNADGSRTIEGTIPYNSPSAGLPWIETISPGAFANALKPGADCLLLRDHDTSQLFGRVQEARTLTLRDSADGLNFSCQLPKTSQAADLVESMSRKDLTGVSFGFSVSKDAWSDDGKGNVHRDIISLNLFEISVCSFAAYPNASASVRSVPKALRSLLKRSAEDGDEDDEDNCDCEKNPDGTHVDPDCTCDEEDDEDRSKPLNWSERTLLQIEVSRRL